MKQFGGVGLFTLHPQKNFERHSSSRRSGHLSLLSQMVAGSGPVAVDEFLGAHASLALDLNFDELQCRASVFVFVFTEALAAANKQARSLDCHFSGCQLGRMLPGL